ncbi:DUF2489 domain-containing protein [Thaumasiovibrio sp. DFM-14]|uniref:DUF2489 domain-containing protein n=1 Tax=Thaumasiovibrio sp. DFM-14 TaxID=3384792 RepID=UPI0039A0E6B2
MPVWLLVLGGSVVTVLAVYAGMLLTQLWQQKQRQQQAMVTAIAKRNHRIFDSIFVIAHAGQEGQCDLSEAAIRLGVLFDLIQGELRVDFAQRYPNLDRLYHAVKALPRGDERKALNKQVRMRQDVERMKLEAELQEAIMTEFAQLLSQRETTMSQLRPFA